MGNIFDRIKKSVVEKSAHAPVSGAAVDPPSIGGTAIGGTALAGPSENSSELGIKSISREDDIKGEDARRLAEKKADAAGAKRRREAEARGEISKEIGGPKGLEPTRYGDWEKAGRCFDF